MLVGVVLGSQALASKEAIEEAKRAAAVTENTAVTFEARQQALKQLEESARLFLLANEPVEAAQVLNRVGRLQLALNLPLSAIDTHNRALSLLKQSPSVTTRVDNLNGLAEAYLERNQEGLAQTTLRLALKLSKRLHYTRGEAQALQILSDEQNHRDHVLALRTAQQALTLWNTLDDKAAIAGTYAQIGQYYMAQNLLPEATQSYRTSLQLSEEMNDDSGQARALIQLGFIEFRKGNWQADIDYQTRAEKLIDEKTEPHRMGQVAVGLAEAFNESGSPDKGLVQFQRAQEYFSQTQGPAPKAYIIWGLGCTYYLLGNYAEAVNQFDRALAEVNDEGLPAAQSHEYLGRAYIATREYPAALQHLQRALAVYTQTINPKEAAQAEGLMAEVYRQQGRTELARQYYQRSLRTFVRLSDRLNQAAILYGLGRLELQQNNPDVAENYLRQSIDATEDIRRVSTSSDLTAAFSATVHERYESYIECLMRKNFAQPDRGLEVHAFETSELARARSLTELLRATQTNLVPGLDPQLAEEEKLLRQSLRAKEDSKVVLLGQAYKKEDLEALENELAGLETKYKRVTETIRARYPAYDQISRPSALSLSQIQQQVIADDQTVLLEYSLGSEQSYVWAVTRSSIKSYPLPARSEINEAAQKVYKLLAAAGDAARESELATATQALGQMVLSPVGAELNKQKVIIVADGALNYIPFQILPASSASDEPLVALAEIINAPSASILSQLREETARRQAPTKVLAAFGDPVFASNYAQRKETSANEYVASAQPLENEGWQPAVRDIEPEGDSVNPETIRPLFYSKLELSNLRDVAGPDSFVATGFEATRERLAEADLSQYSILHFATHGILDPKRPERSGLFLSMVDREGKSQNGFVGLQDVYGLRAPVDLVVLSACRTGLGKDVRGEGLIGLTRGFMYAGASSVVASLWKVDDEATAELMKQFYINMLQREMPPAAALRAAQNSIRQQPQWRSPYFWAAFTLQGEYRHSIKHTPARSFAGAARIGIGLAVLLLLISGAWWYRHAAKLRAVKPKGLT